MKTAIIGLGGQGKKYALSLAEHPEWGMELSAISTRGEENQRWARENLPSSVYIAGGEEELYAQGDFDALLITTPHKMHPDIALRAFAQGKHVLCDKPAGVTVGQARQMEEAAREAGLYYGLIFHQKCQPKYRRIKEILEAGTLGEISRMGMENTLYFRTRFYHASGSWRSSWKGEGGGALINQGHHFLCLWQWLFGLPESMYAHIPFGKYNDFAVDDEALLVMDYPGKVTGTFFISTREALSQERLEVVGSKGSLLLEGQKLTLTLYDQDLDDYA
ncbi:MAG: Gfo/Idh/MocA family oxidoreductase, partial [Blautia sp.]|nr:Gfo/Idh/MocA family oxidoreductase [Blautia sp.]